MYDEGGQDEKMEMTRKKDSSKKKDGEGEGGKKKRNREANDRVLLRRLTLAR